MMADSVQKEDKRFFFVEETANPEVLVFGFEGLVKEALVSELLSFGCSVVYTLPKDKKSTFSYIFQKDNLKALTQTLALAKKEGAKFIFLTSLVNPKIPFSAKKLISSLKEEKSFFQFTSYRPKKLEEAQKYVQRILSEVFGSRKTKSTDRTDSFLENEKKLFWPRFVLPLFIILLLLTPLLYTAATFASFYLGRQKINDYSAEFLSGNLINASKKAKQASLLFSFGERLVSFVLPIGKQICYSEAKSIEDSFYLSRLLSQTLFQAAYTAKLSQSIGETIISGRTSLHTSLLDQLEIELTSFNNNLNQLLAQTRLLGKSNSKILDWFNLKDELSRGEQMLEEVSTLASISTRFTKILPEILGFDKPKTFLLLFQNNSELRPTGGFIGSFGWVTFAKGRLIEFKTEDVYTADGQLKGHVPPPEPIKKYLGQENWYLRDSNFDPDFFESAQRAEWFLKHEMNLSFDGVFAFDLNSVQEILRGGGGVYLTDYADKITAENLFAKTQEASEVGFFPGSTQKRDFIGSLARNIFIKLTSEKVAWAKLLRGIKNSLDQKHILLSFHNQEAQELVEQAGWGGRIASVSCQEAGCIPDYLMVVEANLGINKANFALERSAKLNINLESGRLEHELRLTYTNQSPGSVFPGGDYFSYTRILLPKSAVVLKVETLDGEIVKEDLTLEEYHDKLLIGFPLRVEPKSQQEVHLNYYLPTSQDVGNIELLVQKQPGIKPYQLEITITSLAQVKTVEISGDNLLFIPL